MLFVSYGFVFFLIVLTTLYYLVPGKIQPILLLVGSWIFYFFSGWVNIIYLLSTILMTYICSISIEMLKDQEKCSLEAHKTSFDKEIKKEIKKKYLIKRKRILTIGIISCIGMLAVIKYSDFVIYNINSIISCFRKTNQITAMNILLPMGISFYVFQSVGYLIDVYRGKIKAEKSFINFSLFVSFFPQLIQGPISRYDKMADSLYQEHRFDRRKIAFGIQRILWGYFKKLVIADRLLIVVRTIVQAPYEYDGAFVFAGMVFYAAQLYCDFTGGIDITIGIAEMLGITIEENFNRPYFSKSLKEFWNRWHISMGKWFTEYLFYPMSISRVMIKTTRWARNHLGDAIGRRISVYISCIVVWIATGIWHGAGWNFVAWGLGNCIILLFSQEMEPFYKWFHSKVNVSGKRWWDALRVLRTLLIVSILRLFDCYRDVPVAIDMFKGMIRAKNWNIIINGSLGNLGLVLADYMVVIFGIIIVFMVSLAQRKEPVRERIVKLAQPVRFAVWLALFMAIIVFGAYGKGYDAAQFIYNQF